MAKVSKKNELIIILAFSLYLFTIIGFFFHTSSHPQLFGKYTIKYAIFLAILIISPPLFFILFRNFFSQITNKKNLLILAIAFLIVLTISEIYLRNKYKNYESTNYMLTLQSYHPFLQSQMAQSDNLHINSLGFRGEEINRVKQKGTFRIVVLGGSTVLNREVPYEKNAVRLLEKALQAKYRDKKIEVINAGVSGYTSQHSLIQYLFKIRDLKPDLIVMWHGINDMWMSCTNEGITHGPYKPDYSHAFGLTSRIVFDYFQPQPFIQIKLVSVDLFIKMMKDNLYSDITKNITALYAQKRAEAYKENKNTIRVRNFPSIEAYKRNVSYLAYLAKHDNVPFIVGNQPNLLKANPSVAEVEKIMFPTLVCQKDNKYYDLDSLHYGITMFNTATKQIALNYNIYFVDLDSKIPRNLSYFTDNVHYTEKGNVVIANTLFDEIVKENFIH